MKTKGLARGQRCLFFGRAAVVTALDFFCSFGGLWWSPEKKASKSFGLLLDGGSGRNLPRLLKLVAGFLFRFLSLGDRGECQEGGGGFDFGLLGRIDLDYHEGICNCKCYCCFCSLLLLLLLLCFVFFSPVFCTGDMEGSNDIQVI